MQKYAKTSWTCNGAIAMLVAVVCLLVNPQRLEANLVIINDGMANPANYSFGFFNSNPGNPDDISSMSSGFYGSGGNPDEFLSVTHLHDVTRGDNGEPPNGNGLVNLNSLFTYLPTTYSPSVSGSIENISFSLDIRYETNQADFSQLFFTVGDENGIHLGAFTNISTNNGWHTITATGLTGLEFPGRDFSGSVPLSFGFGFYSNVNVFGGSTTSMIEADNFVVSVAAVPEPGSIHLLLMAFAACALTLRRRR